MAMGINGNYSSYATQSMAESSAANRTKEMEAAKTAKRKEELQEELAEKMDASLDGVIYLDETDGKKLIEAAKEENEGKSDTKGQHMVGAKLDLQV